MPLFRLTRLRARGLAALLLILSAAPASALNWRVSPADSVIAFAYQEDGEAAEGRFERFRGVAEFDAAQPERARLDLEIQIDSIALSSRFRSDFVKGESWFDAESFPIARFTLDQIALAEGRPAPKPGEPGRYLVEGALTIKGRSRPIRTAITLTLTAKKARAVGRVAFSRSEFGVGDALGALFVDIGDEIAVEFDIAADRI